MDQGISGNRDGIASLPDGIFQPAFPLNAVEDHFKEALQRYYADRYVISARCAHLSKPEPIHMEQGRVKCQHRTLCQRGCPFGGYFSSNAVTLPWAEKTGNLTLRPFSVVESILYDEETQQAKGVRVVDTHTKESFEYYAKLIFVNESTINTNLILLNSTSDRFPNGLGNDSGVLGQYVAFHNYSTRVYADYDGDLNAYKTEGRNPAGGGYIPRFRNLHKQETDFLRGYATGFSASRSTYQETSSTGAALRDSLLNPKLGHWWVGAQMMGETIPKKEHGVFLDQTEKDAWGVPLVNISVGYDENDDKMSKDFVAQFSEMYEKAGFHNIHSSRDDQPPGLDIHEMGGVRMGRDPKTSMLNEWNQLHACKNVFVTDGACMTSTSTQNPSLTYMALTARAVDFAILALKKGDI